MLTALSVIYLSSHHLHSLNSLACQHNCPSEYSPSCAIRHVHCVLLYLFWHTCGSTVQVVQLNLLFLLTTLVWGMLRLAPNTPVVNATFKKKNVGAYTRNSTREPRDCDAVLELNNTKVQVVRYNLSYRK